MRRASEPAPTITAGHDHNERAWFRERPATTVACDPRVHPPGHKTNSADPPGKYDTRAGKNAALVTLAEAAVLQGFEPGYPFQGTKTKQFEQVGNAVPPPLAAAVLRCVMEEREDTE